MRFLVSPLPEGNVCLCVCVWGEGWPSYRVAAKFDLGFRVTSLWRHPFPEFFLASFPALFLVLLFLLIFILTLFDAYVKFHPTSTQVFVGFPVHKSKC